MWPVVLMSLDSFLLAKLDARKSAHRYRSRLQIDSAQGPVVQRDGRSLINFCSNDYLGLASHPAVNEAFIKTAKTFGVGSGASHLVCGHSLVHHDLEQQLAAFVGRERALLFSTGFMANLAVVSALMGRGDAVVQDKLNHASLIDAGQLSGAKVWRYKHNDMAHCEARLKNNSANNTLLVTDGVFSMDGDMAPLKALSALAQNYQTWLMVDDAHGFGVLGDTGAGIAEALDLNTEQLPIYMATLGKAAGTFGAFVAGSHALIESLIQFARPYIYTTAMPPAVAGATMASLQVMRNEPERRVHLKALINQFCTGAKERGIPLLPSATAIQPVMVNSDERALFISNALVEKGFWVSAIRPPTVPEGTARLRVTLTASHSAAHVASLLEALTECLHASDEFGQS